ncbi:MAG TPA: FecR domain-containing protein [Gemmataceae bacterium]|nr:FecR domain-containing protein [Gemmataceae bacterium]
MDCEQAQALLQAHMDRELLPDDRPRLDAHLRGCATCRAAAAAYRLQDADLRLAFQSRRQASAAVADRVIAQLRGRDRTIRRRLPWTLMVMSAAAGFLLAFVVFRPWQKSADLVRPEPGRQDDQAVLTPLEKAESVVFALAAESGQTCEVLAPNGSVWQTLQLGGKIAFGTRVRTAPSSRCEFQTPDGSEIRLNGGTEVLFADRRRLELARGQILARVEEAAAPFRVRIPNATITALGTEFDLLCQSAESVLSVLEGATRVEGKERWQTVQSGEKARIVNGVVTHKEQLGRRLDQATDWALDLLKLKGPNNKEVARRVNDILASIGETKTGSFNEDEIRKLGYSCTTPLTRYVQSERSKNQVDRRIMAMRIVADLAPASSVSDLIELLGDRDPEIRYYAALGLKRLTHETLGHEPKEWRNRQLTALNSAREQWRRWWEKNKQDYPEMPQPAR